LPLPIKYFEHQGLKLIGDGQWKSTRCPFHDDTHPSLRVHTASGAFRCMVCGTAGGDVIAFHMLLYKMHFVEAAKALGAWRDW
jgi:DNA primase